MINNMKPNQEVSSPIIRSAISSSTQGILGSHPSAEKFSGNFPSFNPTAQYQNPPLFGKFQLPRLPEANSWFEQQQMYTFSYQNPIFGQFHQPKISEGGSLFNQFQPPKTL